MTFNRPILILLLHDILSGEIRRTTKVEKDDGALSHLPGYLLHRWELARYLCARDWRARLANTARLFTHTFLFPGIACWWGASTTPQTGGGSVRPGEESKYKLMY